jgi:hypothetical protein
MGESLSSDLAIARLMQRLGRARSTSAMPRRPTATSAGISKDAEDTEDDAASSSPVDETS